MTSSRARATGTGAQLGVFAAVLATWQVLSVTGELSRDSFPSMASTVRELARQAAGGEFWLAVGQTLQGWTVGMLIGSGVALMLGTALGYNRFLSRSVLPVIELLKTVPAIAILPLVIVVLGATEHMKIFLVAFGVAWPLTIQVMYGVRAVEPVVHDTARVLQLKGLRRFGTVTLPSAAPFLATGLRVSAATGLILAVVAELVGGAPGLGLSILTAENAGPPELPAMYSFILGAGLLGVVLTGMFSLAERVMLHWHESQRRKPRVTA